MVAVRLFEGFFWGSRGLLILKKPVVEILTAG